MKYFEFTECRVYIAEVVYDNTKTTAVQVFGAYKKRFPEHNAKGYDYEFQRKGQSVCHIYSESVYDFVEQ